MSPQYLLRLYVVLVIGTAWAGPDPNVLSKAPPFLKSELAELPSLNRDRRSFYSTTYGGKNDVVTKYLSDGRVIVAGGEVQVHKIAIITDQSMVPGTPDTYIGIGDYLPSRRHEIYEPSTGAWRNSAPSQGAGGPVAIFEDGRVVKLGKLAARTWKGADNRDVTQAEQYTLEISSQDGNSWIRLDAESPPAAVLTDMARAFIVQNELFLSGQLLPLRGGPDIVQWFNADQGRWETLWQKASDDNSPPHIPQSIERTLSNGKRVILPMEEFF